MDKDSVCVSSAGSITPPNSGTVGPDTSPPSEMGRWALYYASQGLAVLPLHSPCTVSGAVVCSCGKPGCSAIGKHPIADLVPHGLRDATTDSAVIESWWSQCSFANIGIVPPEDYAVLDVDPRHGGDISIQKLEEEHGVLRPAMVVSTGGGGEHWWFKQRPGQAVGNRTKIASGLDVRAKDGYVVAPPSLHASGVRYEWLVPSPSIAAIQDVLPDALWSLCAKPSEAGEYATDEDGLIGPGQRNDSLTSLGGLLRAKGLPAKAIYGVLRAYNQAVCVPPLPDAEVDAIANSVSKYAAGKDVEALLQQAFRTVPEIFASAPQDVPWLVKPWLAKGALTEFIGAPKAGKTTFIFALLSALLQGNPFLGEPTQKAGVVYLSEESDVTLKQAFQRAGLSSATTGLHILTRSRARGTPWAEMARAAVAMCHQVKAELLVVDTFPSFALQGRDENNASDTLAAIEPLQNAAALGLAVLVIRHERKSGGDVVAAGRGSSAFAGAADVMLTIRRRDAHNKNARILSATGRFTGIPDELVIELTPSGFRSLGTDGAVQKQEQEDAILRAAPETEDQAVDQSTLVANARQQMGIDIPDSKGWDLVNDLVRRGHLCKKGKGVKNHPYQFWNPKVSPVVAGLQGMSQAHAESRSA